MDAAMAIFHAYPFLVFTLGLILGAIGSHALEDYITRLIKNCGEEINLSDLSEPARSELRRLLW